MFFIAGGSAYEAFAEDLSEESVDVSLISGGIRKMGVSTEAAGVGDGQLVEQRPEALSITTVNAKSAGIVTMKLLS